MSPIFTPVMGWVAAAGAAFGLAVAAPHESGVLGKVPSILAKRLDHTPVQLPQELSGRTLALVVFQGHQREEAHSWIEGLQLHRDESIRWLKVPVHNDRDAFVRATGLASADHASVLVLDRQGNVLARAQGPFDRDKAQALRETLLARND